MIFPRWSERGVPSQAAKLAGGGFHSKELFQAGLITQWVIPGWIIPGKELFQAGSYS